MIRPLRPMDMPSYLAFASRARGNAIDGGSEPRAARRILDFLGRSLAVEAPKQTWVYADGSRILGVMAIRVRPGSAAWEVERFLGADCPDVDLAFEQLLGHLAGIGGEEGIQKIFLRLPAASNLLPAARRAGFFIYARERMFGADAGRVAPVVAPAPFRPRRHQDHLALFAHYTRVAPVRTRQAEAMTLQEWRWLDGWQPRRHFRFNLTRGRHDYVLWEGEDVRAWMRVEGRSRRLRVTLEPGDFGSSRADAVLAFAVGKMARSGPVYSWARDYESVWEATLDRHGFNYLDEYALLVKQLAVRVGEHCLVPVGV